MHEQHQSAADESEKPVPKAPAHYDSNPFTAAWSGLQKLVHQNLQLVIGVTFFNILLFVVLGLTGVALVLAIAAFVIKQDGSLQTAMPDNTFLDYIGTMNDSGIYLTWVIGLAVCVFVMALIQSLQLNLAIASAKAISLKFGSLLKASIRSTLPILGLISLMLLAILGAIVALAILSTFMGYITLLLGFVAVVAAIYVGLRLSYGTYAIVDRRLGPVAAIRHSWQLSRGHVIETVGSSAVAWLILAIPSLILSALARITEGAPTVSGLFGLVDMALLVVLVIAAAMSVAERYMQLQALQDKQVTSAGLSPFNYLAILLVVFLTPILNALSPSMDSNSQNPIFPELYDTRQPAELEDGSIYRFN